MTTGERIHQFITDGSWQIVAALVGAITWLVRRVLTNQRQIEILQSALQVNERQRKADRDEIRDELRDVKTDVRALTAHLLKGEK